jgi:hypothetical protein
VIKGGPGAGTGFDKGGLDFGSCRKCGGTYRDEGEAGGGDKGKASGEACEVRGICLPAAISSCHSSARN